MTTQYNGSLLCPVCCSKLDLIKDFQTEKVFALAERKRVNIVQQDDKIDASNKHNLNEKSVETAQITKDIHQLTI